MSLLLEHSAAVFVGVDDAHQLADVCGFVRSEIELPDNILAGVVQNPASAFTSLL